MQYAGPGAAPCVLFALLLTNEVVRLGKNFENRRVAGTGVPTPTFLRGGGYDVFKRSLSSRRKPENIVGWGFHPNFS